MHNFKVLVHSEGSGCRPAAPHEQGGPAFEVDALGKLEALRSIGREHARHVRAEQARQHQLATHIDQLADGRRHLPQGPRQNIGKDQVIGGSCLQGRMQHATGNHRAHPGGSAVQAGIGGGRSDRDGVDVASRDRPAQGPGGCNGKHARAGAHIEHLAWAALAEDLVEHQQAAARGAMVPSAKGQGGLDLKADLIGLGAASAVGPMDEEAPGPYRLQSFEGGGDPVLLGDAAEDEFGRGLRSDRIGHEFADEVLVGFVGKEDLDDPGQVRGPAWGCARFLEGRRRRFRRIEHLDDEIRDGAGRRFVAAVAHHMSGVVGGHSFEHGAAYHGRPRLSRARLYGPARVGRQCQAMSDDSSFPDGCLRRPLLLAAGGLAALVLLASQPLLDTLQLTEIFFYMQDIWVLMGMVALLLVMALMLPRLLVRLPVGWEGWRGIAILCVATLVLSAAGHWIVFGGYAVSRDEAMALFDAQILRAGRLIAFVPEAWRDFVPALEPAFRLQVAGNVAWLSAYLPGNAALHALFGSLTGPLLACASVWLAWACALRLWPSRSDAALVAAMLVAASPQVLVTAMTPYAANAHLALDLLWLWLFLRGGKLGHAGALATGALATGLHQIVFHPLFVAPFILGLWWRRCWRPALTYTLGYGVICLFWLLYWRLLLSANGLAPGATDFSDLATRTRQLLADFEWTGLALMLKNALRFFSWMVPILLPLLCVAIAHVRQWRWELWGLAAGIVVTTLFVFVLIPYQGHGWGYRYWHGLIGNFGLLATAGYVWLTDRDRATPFGAVMVTAGVSIVVFMPLRALQVSSFIAPYERAAQAIGRAVTDLVIVDRADHAFTADLVRNDPFLRHRPLILDLSQLSDEQIRTLCARGPLGYFGPQQAADAGIFEAAMDPLVKSRLTDGRALMTSLGCGMPISLAR